MSGRPSTSKEYRAGMRKRKKLINDYARKNSEDGLFKNFSLPDDLSLQVSPPKKTRKRNLSDDFHSGVGSATGNDDSMSCSEGNDENDISSYNLDTTPSRRRAVNERRVDESSEEEEEDGENSTNTSDNGDDDDEDGDAANPFDVDGRGRWSEQLTINPTATKLDVVAGILAIADRFNLTYAAVMQIMKLVDSLLLNSSIPKTISSLWKSLGMDRGDVLIRHYYCPKCRVVIGSQLKALTKCPCPEDQSCSKKEAVPYFIQFKIEHQFRRLIENPTFLEALRYPRTRQRESTDIVQDMFDGEEYKKLAKPGKFLSNVNNFSLTLNTDGCSVANSSNASAWPILLQINELPPHMRKRVILLAGIWVDKSHPNLTSLLTPTVVELQQLYMNGVQWTNPIDGRKMTSKLITTVCSVDTPARSDVLNMLRFNGKFGCTFCKARGETASDKNVRIYPIAKDGRNLLRTDHEMRKTMNECYRTSVSKVFGIKGPSALMILPEFNLYSGVIVESMHNCYLGVTKRHTMLLFDPNIANVRIPKMSVVRMKTSVNKELVKIRRPSKISRDTRPVDEFKSWKASEWRNWILYYALICLEGVIVDEQLKLLSMLSEALYVFNKDCITVVELRHARNLIERYTQGYENFFGKNEMKFNNHLLTHLPDTVQNWGPLWSHSAFPFESWNKKIIDRVTSANSRPLQIATRQLMGSFVENLLYNPKVSVETKTRLMRIHNDGKRNSRRRRYDREDCTPSNLLSFDGKGKSKSRNPRTWETQALQDAGINDTQMLICFRKATVGGLQFERYDPSAIIKRHCDEYIYCDNVGFARILDIVKLKDNNETKYGFFVQLLTCVGDVFEAKHINIAELSTEKIFLQIVNKTPKPAIHISTSNLNYVVALGNLWESD